MNNLWSLVERNVSNFGKATAIRYPAENRTLSWQELKNQALATAAKLAAGGIGQGDRVGLLLPNCPEFVTSFFAITALGATVVPVNPRFTSSEINYILKNSKTKGLVFASEKEQLAKDLQDEIGKEGLVCLLSKADMGTQDNSDLYSQTVAAGKWSGSGDIAELLYTSGTTGNPKGVMLSHTAVIAAGQILPYEAQIYHGDNVLILMPLTHSAPLNLLMVGATWAGASMTLGEFTPQTLLELVQQERTTHFFGAPVVYQLLSRIPNIETYDLNSMKYWLYGGAPAGKAQIEAWQRFLPGSLMSVYGLTEAGPNGLALRPQEAAEKLGSIGSRGAIGAEVKVVRDDGSEINPGESGEILLRTASMMEGYFENPVATQQALKDGWLHTGDVATRDEEGYIWVFDRKKDIIISGGVNIYPKEIEDLLLSSPEILDAAVIGIPHPDWGESVCAVVTAAPEAHPTLESTRAFCQGKLADYKIPRIIKVVPALPRNSSGKLLKYMLR